VGETPTLTTNAFKTYPIGVDTHTSTDWQVATDAAFSSVVWESLADTSNLESIQVPGGTLTESTVYYLRARHSGASIGSSGWSDAISFTTSAQFVPTAAGTPYEGGYYVCRMLDELGDEYALVVSPKASGELAGSESWSAALSFADSVNAGGYDDWKLADLDEMRALYWNLKPSTATNNTGFGASTRIIPQTANYTTIVPAQTPLTQFKSGGSEELKATSHWTENEYNSSDAWRVDLVNGAESKLGKTYSGPYARAVRRVYL
jgi:RES domain-containing protein